MRFTCSGSMPLPVLPCNSKMVVAAFMSVPKNCESTTRAGPLLRDQNWRGRTVCATETGWTGVEGGGRVDVDGVTDTALLLSLLLLPLLLLLELLVELLLVVPMARVRVMQVACLVSCSCSCGFLLDCIRTEPVSGREGLVWSFFIIFFSFLVILCD